MNRLNQFVYNCLFFVGVLLFLTQIALSTVPDFFWWSEPLALLTPVFLLFALICLIFFALLRSKKAFLALFILLMHSDSILNFVQNNEQLKKHDFAVLSFNVRVFNKYPQLHDNTFKQSERVVKFLQNSGADIICLQEFYHRDKGGRYNLKSRLDSAGYHFSELLVSHIERGGGVFGMAVFSKHPVKQAESFRFMGSKNGWQRIELEINERPLVIYNCHMESYRVTIDSGDYAGKQKEGLRSRVKRALNKRGLEFNKLYSKITQEDNPVVLTGDFNSSPFSYGIYLLRSIVNDSYRSKGEWYSGTMNKAKIPSIRIDYQFYSNELIPKSLHVEKSFSASDHFPVMGAYDFVE